jgi:hypothetical protein
VSGDECRASDLGLEHRRRHGREVVDARAARGLPGAGVSRQVDRDHAMAPNEIRQQLDPVPGRAGEPVQEEKRLTRSAGVVVDRDPGDHQVFRLQPGQVRCGRHARRVSSEDYVDSGGAGPLIPATKDERAMSEPA